MDQNNTDKDIKENIKGINQIEEEDNNFYKNFFIGLMMLAVLACIPHLFTLAWLWIELAGAEGAYYSKIIIFILGILGIVFSFLPGALGFTIAGRANSLRRSLMGLILIVFGFLGTFIVCFSGYGLLRAF